MLPNKNQRTQLAEATDRAEAERVLTFLAGMPLHGHSTLTRKQLRYALTRTGGTMIACGDSWDVVSKHLGAGIYRVSLRRRP
jgi:hypothetical protein